MKFHSEPIAEHNEAPLADDGRWEQLLAQWAKRRPTTTPLAPEPSGADEPRGNACYVVSVGEPQQADAARDARLAEILALVRAQGDTVVGHEPLTLRRIDPRTVLGKGAAEAVAERARAARADLLVLDCELRPSQARNLEDTAGLSVCDREAVILNVFLRHAKTPQARIQVEIAHLQYLRPRIRGLGLDMDQQAGGMMTARGPGETASELLARRLDGRLVQLRRAFARLKTAGQHQRKRRDDCARIVLVGYTNAGKTSLMNALTDAGLSARDQPFETLDTTSRSLCRHGGDVVLSDTVGFIRRLPERLLESFESTLSEIAEASLVAVVADLSDPECALHLRTTEQMLEKLGAARRPRLVIFNKADRVATMPPTPHLHRLAGDTRWHTVSAHDPDDVARLRTALLAAARHDHQSAQLLLPYHATELLSRAYARCRVLDSTAVEHGLVLRLQGPAAIVHELRRAARRANNDRSHR